MELKASNIDGAISVVASALMTEGKARATRGFNCVELPEPLMVHIENPNQRYVFNKERKWNKFLGFAETLWILAGANEMDTVGKVVKNLYSFSDDGKFMRAGYGPRIRQFTGVANDYECNGPDDRPTLGSRVQVDQFYEMFKQFEKDPNTRQASITIHDPAKDCLDFNTMKLKETKDQPCTRLLQYMISVDGKLNATTYMRSNDFLWGFSAVNVFNFTMIQELVAGILGVPVGTYTHVVNNMHYYENFTDKVKAIRDYDEATQYEDFHYEWPAGFDIETAAQTIDKAYREFKIMVNNQDPYYKCQLTGVDFFDDILRVLSIKFNCQSDEPDFVNPNITKLFEE